MTAIWLLQVKPACVRFTQLQAGGLGVAVSGNEKRTDELLARMTFRSVYSASSEANSCSN